MVNRVDKNMKEIQDVLNAEGKLSDSYKKIEEYDMRMLQTDRQFKVEGILTNNLVD